MYSFLQSHKIDDVKHQLFIINGTTDVIGIN